MNNLNEEDGEATGAMTGILLLIVLAIAVLFSYDIICMRFSTYREYVALEAKNKILKKEIEHDWARRNGLKITVNKEEK